MASNTKETEFKRQRRHKNAGQERKRKLRNRGSTPAFPIHTPEADANAPAQVSPRASGNNEASNR